MSFPISAVSNVATFNGDFARTIVLHGGLTVLLGPNGSGKTHLLRGLKGALLSQVPGKKVRFLSAGRMGPIENYRSDYDGQRGGNIRYEHANHGAKDDAKRRHDIETLNGDFQTLAQRADILIKIQERLRKLFRRDVIVEWDAGSLKISFARLDAEAKPYSSGREASGLLHLVGILAALYDDEVGALLIDEPEVSLHPQLQAFLLKEIVACAGLPADGKKLIVIATHSTEFVQISRPEDLCSLAFAYDLNEEPVQIAAGAGELQSRAIRGLVARLGQEHKLALFAKRPLLVEGPSDVIIASGLASALGMHLEAAGSQLLPVVGKGQMPVVAKLMRMMGKEPVVLADADAIADDTDLLSAFLANNSAADSAANSHGAASATNLVKSVYNDFCKQVDEGWDAIKSVAETHAYWINRDRGVAEELAKRRASLSTLFQLNADAQLNQPAMAAWKSIRDRLKVVFELAESAGLFVLRRGSIEAYYQSADTLTSLGKPIAAANELEWIASASQDDIARSYDDVVRCVRFAADAEDIREAEALRDILLAIAAPAQAKLQDGATLQALQIMSRSILGDRSDIFELALDGEKLEIHLKSKVLDVSGFPIVIGKGDNIGAVVEEALKIGR